MSYPLLQRFFIFPKIASRLLIETVPHLFNSPAMKSVKIVTAGLYQTGKDPGIEISPGCSIIKIPLSPPSIVFQISILSILQCARCHPRESITLTCLIPAGLKGTIEIVKYAEYMVEDSPEQSIVSNWKLYRVMLFGIKPIVKLAI